MSTHVNEVMSVDGFSVEIVGYCDGEYIWDLDDYMYCRVTDIRIETIRSYGHDKTVLVVEFKKEKNHD